MKKLWIAPKKREAERAVVDKIGVKQREKVELLLRSEKRKEQW